MGIERAFERTFEGTHWTWRENIRKKMFERKHSKGNIRKRTLEREYWKESVGMSNRESSAARDIIANTFKSNNTRTFQSEIRLKKARAFTSSPLSTSAFRSLDLERYPQRSRSALSNCSPELLSRTDLSNCSLGSRCSPSMPQQQRDFIQTLNFRAPSS